MRKNILVTGEIYHIFSRSIADYKIFNDRNDFERMKLLIRYYSIDHKIKFSDFIDYKNVQTKGFDNIFRCIVKNNNSLVQIIAYCLMPTHFHLILKQLAENGVQNYISNMLNSYTRYFNTKHRRKGPLWESRYKNVIVTSDIQLLHLTRYVHLNPVTATIVKRPDDWKFSSYKEYISKKTDANAVCQFEDILTIKSSSYQKFVNNQIAYQKELAKIKRILLD